jgi:hypothetical protein
MEQIMETKEFRNYNILAILKEVNNVSLDPLETLTGTVVFRVAMTAGVLETLGRYELGDLRLEPRRLLRTRDLIFDIARAAKGAKR